MRTRVVGQGSTFIEVRGPENALPTRPQHDDPLSDLDPDRVPVLVGYRGIRCVRTRDRSGPHRPSPTASKSDKEAPTQPIERSEHALMTNSAYHSQGIGLRFAPSVVLTKREAFHACEICAEVERTLLRGGHAPEAARAAALFELLESRLILE
jgi:hypothetical protein